MLRKAITSLNSSNVGGLLSSPQHRQIWWCRIRRYLTNAQTSEALRPFLFAVHPDFFGQYPKERAVNENSLKQLYAYIDSLHQHGHVPPTQLKFYLRHQRKQLENNESFDHDPFSSDLPPSALKKVKISLLASDIHATVSHVLKSCDLSTEHVKTPVTTPFHRQIDWHSSYYAYTGKFDPFSIPKKPDTTLRWFLKKNIQKARKRLEESKQARVEASELKAKLIGQLKLKDIQWESSWDVNSFRKCLRTLNDMCNIDEKPFQILEGHKLVFNDHSMLTCDGSIHLSTNDVPEHWLRFLHNLPQLLPLLESCATLESHFTRLLGGCEMDHNNKSLLNTPIEEHYECLKKVINTIENHYHTRLGQRQAIRIPPGSLKGVKVVLFSHSKWLDVSSEGQVQIGISCQAPEMVQFLTVNGRKARDLKSQKKWDGKAEEELKDFCVEELKLGGLTFDTSITTEQVMTCCKRLLRNPLDFGVTLDGLQFRVSKYYSVLRDGQICFPWDWKE